MTETEIIKTGRASLVHLAPLPLAGECRADQPLKLIFRMWPSLPFTSHPASGLAKATAQKPLTPGRVNQVSPSSGVQAAPPSLAVITPARLNFSSWESLRRT